MVFCFRKQYQWAQKMPAGRAGNRRIYERKYTTNSVILTKTTTILTIA